MKSSILSTVLFTKALGIIALLLALSSTTSLAEDTIGEDTMPRKAQLRKATMAFLDSTHTLKAYYDESPDEQAQMSLETLLRTWGELREDDSVYFAAYSEDGTYVLSLVSDPGEWSSDRFPQVEIERITKGGEYFDAFRVEFPSKEDEKEDTQAALRKIRLALTMFVVKERAVSAIDNFVKERGAAFNVYFSQEEN